MRNQPLVGEPEKTLSASHELFRNKRCEESLALLARAVEDAVARKDLDDAALFSSVRGSYLVAMGRDGEAHEAYLGAERLSGGDAHYRLSTARHSIYGLWRPEDALEVTADILAEAADAALRQEALAIRGIALLHLNQEKEACAHLGIMCSEFSQAEMPAISRDLTLAEELVNRHSCPGFCIQYLALVEGRAQVDAAKPILDRIAKLREALPGS